MVVAIPANKQQQKGWVRVLHRHGAFGSGYSTTRVVARWLSPHRKHHQGCLFRWFDSDHSSRVRSVGFGTRRRVGWFLYAQEVRSVSVQTRKGACGLSFSPAEGAFGSGWLRGQPRELVWLAVENSQEGMSCVVGLCANSRAPGEAFVLFYDQLGALV
ncbi:hypothetical protein Tco_0002415 [Tanacetum coccineum]